MRPTEPQLILGQRSEGGTVVDFDGRGLRTVRLVRRVGRKGFVAEVDPPVPDLDGIEQRLVVIAPRHRGDSIDEFVEGAGTLLYVHVLARVPEGDQLDGVASTYWGELTRNREDQYERPHVQGR